MTCDHSRTKVVETRAPSTYKEQAFPFCTEVVRRRECQKCGYRYSTIEIRLDALKVPEACKN